MTGVERLEASDQLISCRRNDGEILYTLQSKTLVSTEDGYGPHTVCIAKDITLLIKQQQQLHNLANRDRLTGLLNRHAGEPALSDVLRTTQISNQPYALILCDIDHFKSVNDSYGHPVGDRVLVEVAQLLQTALRQGDLCFRWGGEEFLILLPRTRIDNAHQLADRLRRVVSSAAMPEVGSITMSFGVGQAGPGEPPHKLLARVDKALYAAKPLGRDRINVADPAD